MSATEIIEQIQKLPREEQLKVSEFLRKIENEQEPVCYVPDSEFKSSMDKVLNDHADLFRRLAQ